MRVVMQLYQFSMITTILRSRSGSPEHCRKRGCVSPDRVLFAAVCRELAHDAQRKVYNNHLIREANKGEWRIRLGRRMSGSRLFVLSSDREEWTEESAIFLAKQGETDAKGCKEAVQKLSCLFTRRSTLRPLCRAPLAIAFCDYLCYTLNTAASECAPRTDIVFILVDLKGSETCSRYYVKNISYARYGLS